MTKIRTPGLQAMLDQIDVRNALEEAELLRQIKLIKNRFKRRKLAEA